MLFSVYPDLHVAVDDLIAERETRSSSGTTVTGTQQGEFMGTAAHR